MADPLTPSNQHSDEAIAAYPDAPFTEMFGRHRSIIDQRTAFDRGRESKQHTDRETLIGVLKTAIPKHSRNGLIDLPSVADAILAAPSLSLVAARRDFAEKASAHMRANGHGFTRRIDMELLFDALFASNTIKPSSGHPVWVAEDGSRHDHPVAGSGHWVHESRSDVEAAALEAAVEGASGTAAEAIRARPAVPAATKELIATDEMVAVFTAAWEAKRKEIGRGIAPAGTKVRAGLEAVLEALTGEQETE